MKKNYSLILRKIIFAFNSISVIGIAIFILYTTRKICDAYVASDFLEKVNAIPANPSALVGEILVLVAIMGISFICREKFVRENTGVYYLTLLIDFCASFFIVYRLDFNYNGILLWVFVNLIAHIKDMGGKYVLAVISLLSYIGTNHGIISVSTKIFSVNDYIKVYDIVEKNILAIEVSDAGKGMDEEKLKEIKHEKARIALIGTGSRGQYHIHNLKEIPHAQIVAVCDNYAPNLQQALELCPDAKSYTDYRKLLESKDIDGVIISTPLNWHAPIVLDALAAGKHVFCEKAMARTLDECKAIYDTYNQSDKVLYFCMQRMYDEKYIKGMQMIHSGLIGDVVGLRCHWFRNADWRRPVPSPELERKINWRLYKESSGGLMTELACHQLEVCNWAAQKMPESIMGMGDIVYWKDGREVYDSVNVTYRYSDGVKIAYESLISNKFNGMEDQILGSKGTMEMAKGIYYLEEDHSTSGIRQLIDQVKDKAFAAIPTAGPRWRPETKMEYTPHFIINGDIHVNSGLSMIGADKDGSDIILSSFCQSCITGEKAQNVVEEAYCSTVLCLLGNQAMDEQRHILFPDEYKIPYMKF